ncbi:ribosomal protein [Streptococcus equi subsp. zooepidemicus Sz105]|nr:ribosomal protein [Streptococcus equi subsp. zooepidemicus Sz105]HEL1252590.1 ribosomal-processing cysteine protease Prp [Streptococcus equi subsp. zooepidemicus]
MIKVRLTKDAAGWTEMLITGHAGSGEYGFDVVCASVSVLAFNLVNSIEQMTGLEPALEIVDNGGFLRVTKPEGFTEQQEQVWQILFESVVIGLENLAEHSSEYVQKPVMN